MGTIRYSAQLRGFINWAMARGWRVKLYINKGAQVADNLKNAIKDTGGEIFEIVDTFAENPPPLA